VKSFGAARTGHMFKCSTKCN